MAAALVMGCGPGGDDSGAPATGRSTTTSTATTAATTATTAAPATTAVPQAPTTLFPPPTQLLVPGPEGLQLWTEGASPRWLLEGRAVAVALPDESGGVVFQYLPTGPPPWRFDPAAGRWVLAGPDGALEPIYRMTGFDEEPEVLVPHAGAVIRPLDVAVVEGEPALAYTRLVGTTDPAAESLARAEAEVVVRTLSSGEERVVTTVERSGSTALTPRLGQSWLAVVYEPYGMDWGRQASAAFLVVRDLDGRVLPSPGTEGLRCRDCRMRADLPPTGSALRVAEQALSGMSGVLSFELPALEMSPEPGPLGVDGWLAWLESSDEALALLGGYRFLPTGAFDAMPEVRSGGEGAFVELAQQRLVALGHDVEVDGIFGPGTEAAVKAVQSGLGLDPTGVIDAGVWPALVGDGVWTVTAPLTYTSVDEPMRRLPTGGWADVPLPEWTLDQYQLGRVVVWPG